MSKPVFGLLAGLAVLAAAPVVLRRAGSRAIYGMGPDTAGRTLRLGFGEPRSHAGEALRAFAEAHGVPVVESHGGKSSLAWDHPLNLGAIGVDGAPNANVLAREADVVFAVGTRLQDFTTGSHALFAKAGCSASTCKALTPASGAAPHWWPMRWWVCKP